MNIDHNIGYLFNMCTSIYTIYNHKVSDKANYFPFVCAKVSISFMILDVTQKIT